MSDATNNETRRRFLKAAVGATAAAVVLGALPRLARAAAPLPALSESDPTAKALSYVEDAAKSTNPKHKPGDTCANCQFYSGGATGRGPCQLFPGKSVNAKGWCVSHAPKTA